ncbi:MAG: thermonuclease family protein [Chloroflexi bacterium]|nr:thermonuclease family protein [Chloroflexota bacterium]
MKSARKATLYSILPFALVPLMLSAIQVVASLSVASPSELAASPRTEATVTRVIDGGTLEVSIGGQVFQVAYLGLAIPQPVGIEYVKADVLYAAGSAFNAGLVEGQRVTLERDVTNADGEGRLLRWVWKEGQLVNQSIVGVGLAQVNVTPPDGRYEDLLFAAQDKARLEGFGLWSAATGDDCATCAYIQQKAEQTLALES